MAGTSFYREEAFAISLLATAAFQILSAVFWLFTRQRESHKKTAGMFIRITFVIVTALLQEGDLTAYGISFKGPLLGFSYFIITILEIFFYRKLARKKGL